VTQKNIITRVTLPSSPFFHVLIASHGKKRMFIAKPFAESLWFAAAGDRGS
jgi:hypothetical protein